MKRERTSIDYSGIVKRLPEHNQREVTLTLAQVETLASHASESVAAATWIALYTGCCRGELLATGIGGDHHPESPGERERGLTRPRGAVPDAIARRADRAKPVKQRFGVVGPEPGVGGSGRRKVIGVRWWHGGLT